MDVTIPGTDENTESEGFAMAYLNDADILNLIGDGNLSEIEVDEGDENDDVSGQVGVLSPRIQEVEEEIVMDNHFENELNNMDTVSDVIDAVARGDIGLDLPSDRHSSIFDIITPHEEITWEKCMYTSRYPPEWVPHDTEVFTIASPLAYFQKYIPRTLFESAADFTNMYAQQTDSRMKPCTTEEIETLFGIHIAMGNLRFPRVKMYWNAALGINLFLDNMTRDRFFTLRSNLHFVNNLEKPADCKDIFYKVRPIFDAVRNRCIQLDMSQHLSVDEQIIPFTGNMKAKQYIRGKPNPWGLKNFLICGTDGRAYDFLLYQGKTTELDHDMKELGIGAAVVLKLSEGIQREGHKLFFDNYFTSYNMLQILKSHQIFAGGTARLNRFFNPPLSDNKAMATHGRGYAEEVVSKDGDVVLCKWQDKRCVLMASNFLSIGETDTVKRWDKKEKSQRDVPRPEIIKEYNFSMGGVDLFNRLISLYRINVRSRKWPLRMIFHAVDMAVTNSWLEYKEDCRAMNIPNKDVMDLLAFRSEISKALITVGKTVMSRKRGRPSLDEDEGEMRVRRGRNEVRPASELIYDTVDHIPQHDDKNEPTRCKQKDCGKFRSHWYCHKCKVHLCLTKNRNCFASFHSK